MAKGDDEVIRQHLIDPEICIRCNTCESTCPRRAITHNDRNYVVDVRRCGGCMDCVPPCPTGAIDHWRLVQRAKAYRIADQRGWDALPAELGPEALGIPAPQTGAEAVTAMFVSSGAATLRAAGSAVAAAGAAFAGAAVAEPVASDAVTAESGPQAAEDVAFDATAWNAAVPPWSAAHAYTNLYGPKCAQPSIVATVVGNVRVTEVGREYDTHHVVLDFGAMPFPVLEGQSIGVIPPGVDASGRPHHARQYSVASPRNGERPGYNNVALTVKRVLADHEGKPVRGLASNFLCDLEVGDKVQVIGPFGASFLMPNHPRSNIVMICTGTGSAPMRAMTEWRRRLSTSGRFEGGRLLLFFGARTKEELPYFGPLQNLPKDFIDIRFAFSRTPAQPRRYVQDAMHECAADLAALLQEPDTYFYVCGLKSMETGVVLALRDIARQAGMSWETLGAALKREGRLHLETY